MDAETTPLPINLDDARYPEPPVFDHVVEDVLQRRRDTRAHPPLLGPTLAKARELQHRGAVAALDAALVDVAVAVLNTLSTIRRHFPTLTRRPPR